MTKSDWNAISRITKCQILKKRSEEDETESETWFDEKQPAYTSFEVETDRVTQGDMVFKCPKCRGQCRKRQAHFELWAKDNMFRRGRVAWPLVEGISYELGPNKKFGMSSSLPRTYVIGIELDWVNNPRVTFAEDSKDQLDRVMNYEKVVDRINNRGRPSPLSIFDRNRILHAMMFVRNSENYHFAKESISRHMRAPEEKQSLYVTEEAHIINDFDILCPHDKMVRDRITRFFDLDRILDNVVVIKNHEKAGRFRRFELYGFIKRLAKYIRHDKEAIEALDAVGDLDDEVPDIRERMQRRRAVHSLCVHIDRLASTQLTW